MKRIRLAAVASCSLLLLTLGCSQPQPATPVVDLGKEEAAIRAADAKWLAAAQAHDLENTVNSWTEDATIMPPDQPVKIHGRQAIRDYVAGAFSTPGFSINWKTDQVVVSKSGDMAYSTGTDVFTFTGPNKKLMKQKTDGAVVWRKQPDGQWKAVIDIWNNQGPPTAE